MKKFFKSFVIILTILFLLVPISFGADDVKFKEQVKKEDGSLFEKIIAECIGGIAQTVFDFTTGKDANVGFKDYDELIFNNNNSNDDLSPFNQELWNKTMNWYKVFALISGSLILIAVFILAYKIMSAGMNTSRKNEAKESLMRLLFGGIAIALAPLFIRFLLYMNNSLVHLLVTATNSGTLDASLGNSMLTSIKTGNAITTALVIAMFIYLFVKLNIKFIVRQFTIIIFTIFTPIAAGLWIINKNVTAASIWAGQIVMNIFMQFIYCFLFLIYLAFLPSGGGWAISLIWAMMILPLADALQNCLQNLTSRIAGVDNEQMTNRVVGRGAMMGFGLGAIKEQFKTSTANTQNGGSSSGDNSGGGLKGFVNRAKSIINPSINLSDETDYNGNINPVRNVIPKDAINNSTNFTNTKTTDIPKSNADNKLNITNGNKITPKSVSLGLAKTGYKGSKAYLGMGAKLAEGDFSSYKYKNNNSNTKKNNIQSTEYLAKLATDTTNVQKLGDENELKGKS